MQVEILGADSLGVRSLATFVRTSSKRILIDPGVSVCPRRFGLPPHQLELQALRKVRNAIIERAQEADIIIITHFHHDHFTSFEPRPLDLTDAETARKTYRQTPIYVKSWNVQLNRAQRKRALNFIRRLGRDVTVADGRTFGDLIFSSPVKHGEKTSPQGYLIMVTIADGTDRMVYASDIQLIEPEAVAWIIAQGPQLVVVSGPPIYLSRLSRKALAQAELHLTRLTQSIPTVVVDHHLMRSTDYMKFIQRPLEEAVRHDHKVVSASKFMMQPEQLLEANRPDLWRGAAPGLLPQSS